MRIAKQCENREAPSSKARSDRAGHHKFQNGEAFSCCFSIRNSQFQTSMSNGSQEEEQCDVLVLLATQSFTAEALVEDVLLEKLARWNVQVKLVDEVFQVDTSQHPTDDDSCYHHWPDEIVRHSSLPHCRCPVFLFVVSTFGDGEPPNHALEFASWLSSQRQQPEATTTTTTTTAKLNFPYAVFGLGDRTYQHFAAFGSFVDSRLEKLGGQRILSYSTGDKAGGDQAGEFERWCDCVLQKLETTRQTSVATASSARSAYPFGGTGADWFRSIRQDVLQAKVSEVQELIRKESDATQHQQRSVLHFSLLLPSDHIPTDLQPGDHVGVHPRNHRDTVQKALDWLGLQGHTTTNILEKNRFSEWVCRELTAWEFLSEHLDITGRATAAMLRSMIPFVGTLELRALARELTVVDTEASSTNGNSLMFDAWIAGRRLTALDLVILFECRPSLQGLARICGPLQQRLYSITCVDHTTTEDEDITSTSMIKVGLTVAVAEGGLCSNFMADVGRKGSELSVFCRTSPFRYNQDQKPVLLVTAGSGVGTCLGFIGEILKRNKMEMQDDPPLSKVHLFFGCRTTAELLYGERLTTLRKPKIGLNFHLALSRMPMMKKTYVQDLIVKEAATVWRALFEEEGSMYVCGRLELLAGVKTALTEVAKVHVGQSSISAEELVQRFVDSGRFKSDCWSVGTYNELSVPQRRREHIIVRLERHHTRNGHQVIGPCPDLSSVPVWPSYLRLLASGELERRVNRANDMQSACVACGRMCETNRLSDNPEDWGECRVGNQSIVYSAFAHFGEEDCLVGSNGSGTIFFGACNLKCMYCQNWEISAMDEGEIFSDDRLAQTMLNLQKRGCHNINFVSPTHNVAAILRAVFIAARKGLHLPLVWNTGGYDSVASLRLLDGIVDVYMPDSKYASRSVARKLSNVDNYPEINHAAVKEMHRQVGELQLDPETGLARRGVLVRHLVLPCDLAGTCDVMGFLAKEISEETYTNVMDQYRPEHKALKDKKFGLARRPTRKELRMAHKQAKDAGVRRFDSERGSLQW